MTAQPVLLQQCRRCSQWRRPSDFVVNSIVGFCFACLERHRIALATLAAELEPGCQECRAQPEITSGDAAHQRMRLYLHWKDGLYALLCKGCSDKYERKRLDLYGSTPYGLRKKLKGAH